MTNNSDLSDIIERFKKAKRRLLVLDYDGTCVEFNAVPELAVPSQELNLLLSRLAKKQKTNLVVITGRSAPGVEALIGDLPIEIIAEHGAVAKEGKRWKNHSSADISWKHQVRSLMDNYVRICEGSFVEDKKFSIVWHYRKALEPAGNLLARKLTHELQEYYGVHGIKVLAGHKIVEVICGQINKGHALKKKIAKTRYDFILVIGDDKTDEDMFEAVLPLSESYTIKVGPGKTQAKRRLKDVAEVLRFLKHLSETNES
jgi:trehalose 6-phosphate synthase/phosphatase